MKKSFIFLFFGLFLAFGASASPQYDDFYSENLYFDAVSDLTVDGVLEGYDDGSFRPTSRINRVEFLKLLFKAAEINEENIDCTENFYTDTEESAWYSPFLCYATQKGFVEGYDDGTFKPASFVSAAEGIKMTAEVFALPLQDAEGAWYSRYAKTLENEQALPLTISGLDVPLTRAEASEMMWRIKYAKKDEPSTNLAVLEADFPVFASCDDMQARIEMASEQFGPPIMLRTMEMAEMSMDMAVSSPQSSAKTSGSSDEAFSTTNVQVKGIDEPDRLKNNGTHAFSLLSGNQLRVVELNPDHPKTVYEFDFDEDGFYAHNLLLDGDNLVVIGQVQHDYKETSLKRIMPVMDYAMSVTQVRNYDISVPESPQLVSAVKISGNIAQSRLKDGKVYALSNYYMPYYGYEEQKPLPLPFFEDENGKVMGDCTDIAYFPGQISPSVSSVSVIDIESGTATQKSFMGNTDVLYMSHNAMYATTPSWNYGFFRGFDFENEEQTTTVYKWDLNNDEVAFRAKQRVLGTLKNQFQMDEYAGHLRIATTSRAGWRGQSSNNVFVLNESLQQVGDLTGLAPSEQIYSSRFMGDRLYLVTFQTVDPLFVIDLRVPSAPTVLGELKIPGFSTYLHPYDQDHVLGFGQDAEVVNGNAFTTGFKMALFDVSDVANPSVKDEVLLGERGTSSALLHDHHALLFQKDTNLVAFPLNLSYVNPNGNNYGSVPWGTPVWQGGMMYEVTPETGFVKRGTVSHQSDADLPTQWRKWNGNWQAEVQRMVRVGGTLYSFSPAFVRPISLQGKMGTTVDLKTNETVSFPVVSSKAELDALKATIESEIHSQSCQFDYECSVLHLGASPCGGPSEVLPYATTEKGLYIENLAQEYSRAEAQINADNDVIGTCAILEPSPVICEANRCQFVE